MFFAGLDLGKASDYTALAVVEQLPGTKPTEARYLLRHLERLPLQTLYPKVVQHVMTLLATPPLAPGNVQLILDKTGVGAGVADLFTTAGARHVAVTITGGDSVTPDATGYRVPKRDLAGTLQVLLQTGRLLIAASLPEAATLTQELLNFRYKINLQTGHDSYEAWREGQHDDLVLAVSLATWYAETIGAHVPLSAVEQVYQVSRFAGTLTTRRWW